MKLYDVIQKEKKKKHSKEKEILDENTSVHIVTPRRSLRGHLSIRKKVLFILLLIALLCGIYSIGTTIVRARVTIKERKIPFALEGTLLTIPHESKEDPERLSFQTMTVTTEITREIFGSEFKEVSGKAKGSVIFLNEFSTASQTIRSGTRLVGENNKTYSTQATVTVPGYKTENKKKVPGTSAAVTIIATDTGASFNTQGTTFSVSSFTGTKRKQLYARSVGALTGGEAGTLHTVSDADRDVVVESLKTQLSERLRRETRAQIPEDYIVFPDLQFIFIDTDSLRLSGEGIKFPAKIKGTMVSYLLPKKRFEQTLTSIALSTSDQYTSVTIPELQTLTVTPLSAIPAQSTTTPESISIEVTGEGTIIPQLSEDRLQGLLVGTQRKKVWDILSGLPEIDTADVSFYPFWAPYFPKNEDRIFINYR